MKKYFYLTLLIFILVIISCRKKQEKQSTTTQPSITETQVSQQQPAIQQIQSEQVQQQTPANIISENYIPTNDEYGKSAECPVTGDKFKIGPETPAVKYKGKIYYFCCPMCVPKFRTEPQKYVK